MTARVEQGKIVRFGETAHRGHSLDGLTDERRAAPSNRVNQDESAGRPGDKRSEFVQSGERYREQVGGMPERGDEEERLPREIEVGPGDGEYCPRV